MAKTPPASAALLRALPSMTAVLDAFMRPPPSGGQDPSVALRCAELAANLPRPLLREHITEFLDACRDAIRRGRVHSAEELTLAALLPRIARHVSDAAAPRFRRVLNATGVILHTNLGRSLLAEEAVTAVNRAMRSYTNLELDLNTGERGSRHSHVEGLIRRLTGAEAALAVNNNAAAVLLLLDTLCKSREVVISRGELVEIGGSFRIPAVMEKSGCILREVGATNRTHLEDYSRAISGQTAALMKVHTSNYRIIGFTKEVPRAELAALAREHGLPLLEDLGSGMLLDPGEHGPAAFVGEPVASRVLKDGVDVVTFSGDKVLGGPQAGIIAGKAEYIERIKKNPLTRALRIDKLTLAALEATLRLYLDPELAGRRIPTLRMLYMKEEELRQRAEELAAALRTALARTAGAIPVTVATRAGNSRVGGGAFPERDLPTRLVRVSGEALNPNALQQALLRAAPPLLARVEQDALCLDPRTLRDEEMPEAAATLARALAFL